MVLNGLAHGKLLLFGEHAVVHGFPAAGMTLPLTTRVWLSHPGDPITDPDVPESTPDHTQCVRELVPYLGDTAQALWQQTTWNAHIQSDVPLGRGLGSSAALTGAVARAFARTAPQAFSRRTIWHMANEAERHYHGSPSGVDTALALGTGLLTVKPIPNDLPGLCACLTSPFAVVIGTLPRDTNTRDLVRRVQHRVKTQARETLGILKRLGELAVLPPVLPDAGTVLGARANEAHRLLQTLGLSSEALDQSVQAGLDAGAHGGKLSGAGGGGAFVLFCEDTDTAQHVHHAIHQRFDSTPVSHRPHIMIFQWHGHSLSRVPDKESIS